MTRAFVALSPDFAGIELLDSKLSNICVGDLCQASIWQQSSGSNYYNAMRENAFESLVPTTTIWTKYDGVVTPPEENAQLPGASILSVQDLCPARVTSHITMTVDAAGYALALDALNHGGQGSVSRVRSHSWNNCLRVVAPHMNVSVIQSLKDLWNDLLGGFM